MRQTHFPPKGKALGFEERARLAALVEERGELGAAEHLGINRQTLARAMAGLPCYAGTHAIIASKLEPSS